MFIKEGKNNEIAEALERLLKDNSSSSKQEIKENKSDHDGIDEHGHIQGSTEEN